jgi:hypothetical protein
MASWASLRPGTGLAWVGAVGDESHTELTSLGDAVNVTARLAWAAGAGEMLVTSTAADAAGLDPGLERRRSNGRVPGVPSDTRRIRSLRPATGIAHVPLVPSSARPLARSAVPGDLDLTLEPGQRERRRLGRDRLALPA